MRKLKASKQYLAALAFAAVIGAGTNAQAAVTVYAEGAYSATDLVVNIYADITVDPLVSNGVKIKFDQTKLTVPVGGAQKNETVWYFGDGSVKYPYMNPEVNNSTGQVIFIGGKLDTANPTAGVIGNRVPLGKVKFNRIGSGVVPKNGETYFGVTLENGKGGDYVNYATNTGVSKDSTVNYLTKGVVVRARGDANLDGIFTSLDLTKIKLIISNGPDDSVFADCNGDGIITSLDLTCVKKKI